MPTDDDLTRFAAQGAPALPPGARQGDIEHDGARIWYAAYGTEPTVILLHGGLGHSGNWGYQLPAITCWSSTAAATGAARATHGRIFTIGWPMTCWR